MLRQWAEHAHTAVVRDALLAGTDWWTLGEHLSLHQVGHIHAEDLLAPVGAGLLHSTANGGCCSAGGRSPSTTPRYCSHAACPGPTGGGLQQAGWTGHRGGSPCGGPDAGPGWSTAGPDVAPRSTHYRRADPAGVRLGPLLDWGAGAGLVDHPAFRRARVTSKGGAIEYVSWATATARLLPRLLAGRATGPVFLADRRAPPEATAP